jgi:hypothetical protein
MRCKLIIALFLSLFSIPSLAAHVACYDAGKIIYNENVKTKELDLFEGFYTFIETKSNKLILTNAVCIVDIIMPRHKKHHKLHKAHSVTVRRQ